MSKPEKPADNTQARAEKPYNRDAKLKEILEQDKPTPYADPFMGF